MDCINKLQKEDLYDPELFFKVDFETIFRVLDIKPEGRNHKMKKKLQELREKFEKDGSISYIDNGMLENMDAPSLKLAKSHSLVPKKTDI